ncbi:unnamed protein product [Cuscuta campestris]|uniref:Pectinesterase n=1 Tax=Cuscuta campestris TaxID=132261 RepID=A0A484N8M7_9ASTE|nr:unnamed protein product [Cuscuta campestris]
MDLNAICSSTSYPALCYNRLTTIFGPAADGLGLPNVYTSSVRIAIDELLAASNKLLELETLIDGDRRRQSSLSGAMRFCRELLSVRAFTSLKDSLWAVVGLDDSPTMSTFEDLKTRLTAAGIYHQTCLDAIGGAEDDGRSIIRRADLGNVIKNSTELTSNSLAILYALEESIGATNSSSSGDMQLTIRSEVQEKFYTLTVLRLVADVVVAKDGSGNFTRIGDALSVVPRESDRRVVIYVKAGVYDEIVNVGVDKWNVVMIGDGMDATIVTGNRNSGDGTGSYFSATFST